MTLGQWRNKLKKHGYNVKTERMSWGRAAKYIHLETEDALTYNVMSEEQQERWAPLVNLIKENKEALEKLREDEGITGLIK